MIVGLTHRAEGNAVVPVQQQTAETPSMSPEGVVDGDRRSAVTTCFQGIRRTVALLYNCTAWDSSLHLKFLSVDVPKNASLGPSRQRPHTIPSLHDKNVRPNGIGQKMRHLYELCRHKLADAAGRSRNEHEAAWRLRM